MVLLAGGNGVGVEALVEELDTFWAASLRFVATGLGFSALMLAMRVPLPRGGALLGAFGYGAAGIGLAFGLAFVAIPMVRPGAGQLLLGLVPLLTLVLAPLHGLEPLRPRAIVGSLVALGGLAVLAADRLAVDIPIEGILLALASALFLAEAGVIVKLTPRPHPVATNAVAMLTGGVMLLAVSVVAGEAWELPTQQDSWIALVYLVLLGSLAVFGLFVFVIGRWTASAVSFQFLLIPMATIPVSAILRGEQVTPWFLLGGAVILAGVYFGALAPDRRSGQPQIAEA